MAGIGNQKSDRVMAEINITPFTDVLLVLLIIFMILAALAVPPGFQKQLRKTAPRSAPPDILFHQIEVDISANNRIYIDGQAVGIQNLYKSLADRIAFHASHRHYSTHINLLADQNASYNSVIKVLDAARAAGDEDVGFISR